MENIIENNKLIARFMGGLLRNEGKLSMHPNEMWLPIHGTCRYDVVGLGTGKTIKYHSSWDWLMPVIDKIESLHESNHVISGKNICYIHFHNPLTNDQETCRGVALSRLGCVYKAVLDFINWYNENKKQ